MNTTKKTTATQLPFPAQMREDNEHYKQMLQRHFGDKPNTELIIEALLEARGIDRDHLTECENDLIDDFFYLVDESGNADLAE